MERDKKGAVVTDDSGKVQVYVTAEKRYREVYPVDAVELLRLGQATEYAPGEEKPTQKAERPEPVFASDAKGPKARGPKAKE